MEEKKGWKKKKFFIMIKFNIYHGIFYRILYFIHTEVRTEKEIKYINLGLITRDFFFNYFGITCYFFLLFFHMKQKYE